jgi:hypothetical protein
MSVPDIVRETLGDEQVAAQVSLGGEDTLYVTPTRTVIYRGDGLLSDAAVEEYTHAADRVIVKEGRRKARIVLQDDVEGERSFTVPPGRLTDALHPVLAGVLSTAGVTEPGETVKRTFRFSELTVIVTSRRLVKHIGEAVWDADYEEYLYEDTTGLAFEEGSVATQVVLEVGDRRERIKAPTDQAPELRQHLTTALTEFHDVDSVAELEGRGDDDGSAGETPSAAGGDEGDHFESGLSPLTGDDGATGSVDDDPLGGPAGGAASDEGLAEDPASGGGAAADAGRADAEGGGTAGDAGEAAGDAAGGAGAATGDADPSTGTDQGGQSAGTAAGSGAEAGTVAGGQDAVSNEELAERLDDLTTAVRRQNELLETHAATIEQLIEELKQM